MKKKKSTRLLALFLTLTFVGCGNEKENTMLSLSEVQENDQVESAVSNNEDRTEVPAIAEETENEETANQEINEITEEFAEEERKRAEEEKKLDEQRNSFSMMYYLAITAEEIRTSKDKKDY